VPDDSLSLADGAIGPWARGDKKLIAEMLAGLESAFGVEPGTPFASLSKKHRDIVLFGASGRKAAAKVAAGPAKKKSARGKKPKAAKDPFGADFEGVIPNLRRRFEEATCTEQ